MKVEDDNHKVKFTWQYDRIHIVIVGIDLVYAYTMDNL
jgi:hypothetical protein